MGEDKINITMLSPVEMVEFLENLAAQAHGYELKSSLFQCAVYIRTMEQAMDLLHAKNIKV